MILYNETLVNVEIINDRCVVVEGSTRLARVILDTDIEELLEKVTQPVESKIDVRGFKRSYAEVQGDKHNEGFSNVI